jgi:hypothetical protein
MLKVKDKLRELEVLSWDLHLQHLQTEHNSYLLALHMFGNHLYMCADW